MSHRPDLRPHPTGPSGPPGADPHAFSAAGGPARTTDAAPIGRVASSPAPAGLRLVYLTTDDPLYLPAFYERVLAERHAETLEVCVAPTLYRRQTPLDAALRYARTFGLGSAFGLANRVLAARLRGQSVAATCARWKVGYREVPDVNAPEFLDRMRRLAPDVMVSVSCPQIFKRPLLEIAPLGVLNVHGAILPHYRGVLPSFWMLANGEREAGVSITFVNEEIDAGDRCGLETFPIHDDDTLDSFLRRSKAIAADLLLKVLERLEHGKDVREPLEPSRGSYYSWPDAAAVARFRARGRKVW